MNAASRRPPDSPRRHSLLLLGHAVPTWLVAAVIATLTGLAAFTAMSGLDTWPATHWLFRYGDGLRRRALVGSLVSWPLPSDAPRAGLILLLSLLALTLLIGLLVWLSLRALQQDGGPRTVLLVLALAVSPGTVRFLAHDLGRFDTLNLVLVVGVLLLLPRLTPVGRTLMVAAAGAVGVLVHELFLVAFLPLALVALAISFHDDETARAGPRPVPRLWPRLGLLVLAALPALVAAAWVLSAPGLGATATAELAATLAARSNLAPDLSSLAIHSRDLTDNLAFTVDAWTSPLRRLLAGTIVPVVLVLPTLLIALLAVSPAGEPHPEHHRRAILPTEPALQLLLAAAAAPLTLHVIGIDHGRWWALCASNVVIATLWWQSRIARGSNTPRSPRIPRSGEPATPAPETIGTDRLPHAPPSASTRSGRRPGPGPGSPLQPLIAALTLVVLALMPPPGVVQGVARADPTTLVRELLSALRTVGPPL